MTDVPLTQRNIVAIGGGGFLGETSPALDDYLLRLTGKPRPRVCFIPTAAGDGDAGLVGFYRAFHAERGRATDLTLFRRTVDDIRSFLLDQDLIYVGGGNTASMLAVWRAHGVGEILREAWAAGIVVGGVSAGAICWFEGGVTDSFGPRLAALRDGLGILPGTFCPHYDSDPNRRPTYHRLVGEGFASGYAADDGVGLHFVGTDLASIVSSRPDARAYRVERRGDAVVETPLQPTYLG
jgi:peptidase E